MYFCILVNHWISKYLIFSDLEGVWVLVWGRTVHLSRGVRAPLQPGDHHHHPLLPLHDAAHLQPAARGTLIFCHFVRTYIYLYIMMMLKRFPILKVIILLLARYILFNVPVHARTIPEVSSWFSSSNFLSQVLIKSYTIFNHPFDARWAMKKMAEVFLSLTFIYW